ncbi:MAG: trypsin-like peptidase domain-containing protein [Chloroflexi bacterium]|nr:trypsin-like peptidase domain-containing protein [Chloroflexota bacterium]
MNSSTVHSLQRVTERWAKRSAGVIVILVVLGVGYAAGWSARDVSAQERMPLTTVEKIYANLYNQISPSVVSIGVVDPLFGAEISNGSGFVIDADGHVLTNAHVVDDSGTGTFLEVTFFDGTHVRGSVVGVDPESDLAVLRVNLPSDRLRPVIFADSDDLVIGQSALAIGSPFGQRWTMTAGIISALDRTIEGLGDFQIGAVVQTDAPINPGNSGGPLLNLAGEVIGVNAQIISETRANSGVGFAIPSNLAMRVADDLRANGRVEYAYLGVQRANDITLSAIERLGLPNDTRGLVIGGVTGPAEAAGLRSNDVITAINGLEVSGLGPLLAYLATYTLPGQTVTLSVLRDGQLVDLAVELGSR